MAVVVVTVTDTAVVTDMDMAGDTTTAPYWILWHGHTQDTVTDMVGDTTTALM